MKCGMQYSIFTEKILSPKMSVHFTNKVRSKATLIIERGRYTYFVITSIYQPPTHQNMVNMWALITEDDGKNYLGWHVAMHLQSEKECGDI